MPEFPTLEEYEAKMTLEDFEAWCQYFGDDEYVGHSMSASQCPLTRFTVSRAFGCDVVTTLVSQTLLDIDSDRFKGYNMPLWARAVRYQVDHDISGSRPITGEIMRGILAKAKRRIELHVPV